MNSLPAPWGQHFPLRVDLPRPPLCARLSPCVHPRRQAGHLDGHGGAVDGQTTGARSRVGDVGKGDAIEADDQIRLPCHGHRGRVVGEGRIEAADVAALNPQSGSLHVRDHRELCRAQTRSSAWLLSSMTPEQQIS